MSSRKSFTQKKREERIQKNLEKMGAPSKPPKPKTLRQTAKRQLQRARLIQKYPISSTDKKVSKALGINRFIHTKKSVRDKREIIYFTPNRKKFTL